RAWLVLVHNLGLDDFVIAGLSGRLGWLLGTTATLRLGLSLGVDRRAHLLAGLGGLLGGRPDRVRVGALEGLLQIRDRLVDLGLDVVGQLVGVLGEELLRGVGEGLGPVADLGLVAALAVFVGVLLGVRHHALDLVLAERRAARDRHGLLLACAQVFRRHVDDAVRVDVEGDL